MHKRASTASRRPWERRRMEVKVVDVTKGVFLLLFFYPQILSQLGERCVPMYIEKHYACSRCSNHRRFGEGEHESEHVCVSVCVCMHAQWQLAEEVRHAFGHMGHGARLASQFLEVKVRTASTKMCHHQFLKAKEEEASDSKNSISFWGPRIGGSRDVRGKKICGILREIYRRRVCSKLHISALNTLWCQGLKLRESVCVCNVYFFGTMYFNIYICKANCVL